ncbi:TPA: hypothetical protein N0F65_007743 [Lagenidium giganteum]|uniref:Uncharacterized protein n=1 Tax=Lagenidium giganteum TaxID=4803 RepID=A0AAV2Z5G7_9STRA|nr:TPA: hypothetical protein N0F65_007743 [Lagenidium giganteum]
MGHTRATTGGDGAEARQKGSHEGLVEIVCALSGACKADHNVLRDSALVDVLEAQAKEILRKRHGQAVSPPHAKHHQQMGSQQMADATRRGDSKAVTAAHGGDKAISKAILNAASKRRRLSAEKPTKQDPGRYQMPRFFSGMPPKERMLAPAKDRLVRKRSFNSGTTTATKVTGESTAVKTSIGATRTIKKEVTVSSHAKTISLKDMSTRHGAMTETTEKAATLHKPKPLKKVGGVSGGVRSTATGLSSTKSAKEREKEVIAQSTSLDINEIPVLPSFDPLEVEEISLTPVFKHTTQSFEEDESPPPPPPPTLERRRSTAELKRSIDQTGLFAVEEVAKEQPESEDEVVGSAEAQVVEQLQAALQVVTMNAEHPKLEDAKSEEATTVDDESSNSVEDAATLKVDGDFNNAMQVASEPAYQPAEETDRTPPSQVSEVDDEPTEPSIRIEATTSVVEGVVAAEELVCEATSDDHTEIVAPDRISESTTEHIALCPTKSPAEEEARTESPATSDSEIIPSTIENATLTLDVPVESSEMSSGGAPENETREDELTVLARSFQRLVRRTDVTPQRPSKTSDVLILEDSPEQSSDPLNDKEFEVADATNPADIDFLKPMKLSDIFERLESADCTDSCTCDEDPLDCEGKQDLIHQSFGSTATLASEDDSKSADDHDVMYHQVQHGSESSKYELEVVRPFVSQEVRCSRLSDGDQDVDQFFDAQSSFSSSIVSCKPSSPEVNFDAPKTPVKRVIKSYFSSKDVIVDILNDIANNQQNSKWLLDPNNASRVARLVQYYEEKQASSVDNSATAAIIQELRVQLDSVVEECAQLQRGYKELADSSDNRASVTKALEVQLSEHQEKIRDLSAKLSISEEQRGMQESCCREAESCYQAELDQKSKQVNELRETLREKEEEITRLMKRIEDISTLFATKMRESELRRSSVSPNKRSFAPGTATGASSRFNAEEEVVYSLRESNIIKDMELKRMRAALMEKDREICHLYMHLSTKKKLIEDITRRFVQRVEEANASNQHEHRVSVPRRSSVVGLEPPRLDLDIFLFKNVVEKQRRVDELTAALGVMEREVETLEKKVDVRERENQQLKTNQDNLTRSLNTANAQVVRMQEENERLDVSLKAKQDRIRSLISFLEDKERQILQLDEAVDLRQTQLDVIMELRERRQQAMSVTETQIHSTFATIGENEEHERLSRLAVANLVEESRDALRQSFIESKAREDESASVSESVDGRSPTIDWLDEEPDKPRVSRVRFSSVEEVFYQRKSSNEIINAMDEDINATFLSAFERHIDDDAASSAKTAFDDEWASVRASYCSSENSDEPDFHSYLGR